AEEGRCGELTAPSFPFREETLAIFDELRAKLRLEEAEVPAEYAEAWREFRGYAEDWETHPANRIKREVEATGFIEFHLERAREQVAELAREDFRFFAYP